MEQLAHFRLLTRLGAGGMGEVYRARDEKLQRDVAIKVVPESQCSDATAKARLLREARAAAGLSHPNICVIHEVGEESGRAYIAMECVQGEPLSERIIRSRLSIPDALRYGCQLADALAHAHEHGIVHRDLKPHNVMIKSDQRLKVLDFGLAKRMEADRDESTAVLLTKPGAISGTPAYMAPEQLHGFPADERTDIWALGLILYEMVAGTRAFHGSTWAELSAAILSTPPKPLPKQVSAELKAVINRCLEKEPENRYQRAIELRAALDVIHSGVVSGHSHANVLPRMSRVLMAAVVAVLIGAGLYFGQSVSRDARNQPLAPVTAGPAAAAAPRSVAVLPFQSVSGAEDEYLADGIQDSLIVELGKLDGLRVISRTSARAFRESNKSASEIAKALNTEELVEGSVQRVDNRVRIQLKLITTVPEEKEVWAETYDRDMSDVFTLYRELAGAVVTHLDPRLASVTHSTSAPSARKVDPEIYKHYLKAKYQIQKGTKEDFEKGIALLREASERDPMDPLPYAGIATAYALFAHSPSGTPEFLGISEAAARKAQSLDPELPETYVALALLKQYSFWQWNGLEQDFRKALALNPTNAEIRRHYSWYLILQKRGDESIAEMKRSCYDDPLGGTYYSDLGWLLEILGRNTEALAEARRGVELEPENTNNLLVLGLVLLKSGMPDKAIEVHRKVVQIEPDLTWPLAYTLTVTGRGAEAQKYVDQMKKPPDADAFGLAWACIANGDKDEALYWLEIARQRHYPWLPFVGVFAEFVPLRGDPRFSSLLAKIGVPDVEPGFGQPAS